MASKYYYWPLKSAPKKKGRMRKIFAGFIMTVMMLSGCGVAKNLEKSGVPEIAKSKFGGDTYVPAEGQFWTQNGEVIAGATTAVLVNGLAIWDYFYYGRTKTKNVQDPPLHTDE